MRAPVHARRAALAALGAAAIGVVAGCGGSAATSSATATASVRSTATARTTAAAAGPAIALRVATASPEPTAGKLWPIVVTATPKVNGVVSYRFLFNGSQVSHQPGGAMRDGVYRDTLLFPARAEGVPLTLEVVLKTSDGRTADVQRPVSTRK